MEYLMAHKTPRRLAPAFLLAAVTATAAAPPAFAADTLILPAGVGCPDFNLGITFAGGNLEEHDFTDGDGNVVRLFSGGKGVNVTYTNYGTRPKKPLAGESITIKTAGSVTSTVVNPDGTLTVTSTGHNGLILFPTDVPAGPTTTHYIGQLVYNVDPATGVFTLISTTGQERDICAELSS
jgi:hypothetical protein